MPVNKLEQYSENHSFEESEILKGVREATKYELQYDDMLSGKLVLGLLKLLIRIGGYKRILEVGMFTGYATIGMAEELPNDGKITAIEMNQRYRQIAERFIHESGLAPKVEILFGNARELVQTLDDSFDLIFLDADKQFYPTYYNILKPKLRTGGLFVVDNVFWGGGVLDIADRKSEAIHKLNQLIKDDSDMEQVMLTIRDGLLIARKR